MEHESGPSSTGRMSDAAVQAKTGHTWPEWFAILDAAGAQQMTHKQIVAYLVEHHNVGSWWQQMVTVSYEQARGLRAKHQMPDGYQISVGRTIAAAVAPLYDAWYEPNQRKLWLDDADMLIRKATPGKTMRIVWGDGATTLDIAFYPKGEHKTQVVVQHNRLPDAESAAQMKDYWAAAIERLKALLEG
jgi:uncharacterized protein YndB with AHSA1/START domain